VPESNEWRRGWRVLIASSVGVGVGIPALINSAGLFVIPMQREFGWSRGALAIGPIVTLVYSLLNPFGGMVIDRIGARPAAIAGLIALCIALLGLAVVPPNAVIFYLLLFGLGLIGTITNNVVYCKAVATWFASNAGTAIALVLSGVSVVGAVMQPVLARVNIHYGWRMGFVCLAVMTLVAGLPLVFAWFAERPAHIEARTKSIRSIAGTEVADAIRDRRFWLIVAAFAGAAVSIGGFVSQLQPLLISKGYSAISAASLMAVFLLATAVGRLAAGFMFDRLAPATVAAGFLSLSAVGALILGMSELKVADSSLAIIAVALIGLAQGAEGDFIALLVLRIFGLRYFSTLFASIATAAGIGFALGGLMFARVFDRYGDYKIAVMAAASILIFAAATAATIKVPARMAGGVET
jgi:sugar phosphate permease